MNNLFITLEVPELNSHYAQNLQQLVLNINSNFAKIASLPFLKGDSGVSIETHDEPLYTVEEGGTKVYTDFGKSVIKAIYGVDSFPTDEFTINGIHSYDDLMNVQYIPVFYDRVQGLKYLTVPFMFHDARKNELGMIIGDDIAESFEDMSTFVLGKMVRNNGTGEAEWMLESHNFEPKLYYNTETQKFCWAIGSQKTDIIAQGVEGQAGQSVYAKYCQGGFNGEDRTYIYIDAVLNEDNLQDIVDGSGTINDGFVSIDGTNLSVGDFVMVLYNKEVDGGTVEDLSFGKVMEVGGSLCIPYIEGTTIYNTTQNVTLKALLDNIGKTAEGTTTTPNVRGLYVYGETEQSAQNSGRTPRTPHMLWVDGEGIARLSKLKTDRTDSEGNYINQTTQNSPEVDGNGVLQVDYNKFKAKESNAKLFTHEAEDSFESAIQIFKYGKESSDQLELTKTLLSYPSPLEYYWHFIPNPTVTYEEPIDTSTTVNYNGDFLYVEIPKENQGTSNNVGLIKNVVKLNGKYEFDLPYMGLLQNEQSSGYVNKTQQFTRLDGSTTPLTITLNKIALNNNPSPTGTDGNNDTLGRNEEDNTYTGFRHFYDVSLLASPIHTYERDLLNPNNLSDPNIYVYCGTVEEDLKTTINNKDYMTKIKITVLQYEVGYNSDGEIEFRYGTWKQLSDVFNRSADDDENLSDQCQNEVDWYYPLLKQSDGYYKYTHRTKKYNTTDTNEGRNITQFVSIDVPESSQPSTNTWEKYSIVTYNKYSSWASKTANYSKNRRNVVTEVIYYILPSITKGGELDLFDYIKNNDSNINKDNGNYLCMRYRLMFAPNRTQNENPQTIYINKIQELNELGTNLDSTQKGGLIAIINQANSHYFTLMDDDKNPTNRYFAAVENGNTDANRNGSTGKEDILKVLGEFDDFCWCYGQPKTDYNLADGLGSGKLLPVDPSKIIKYKNNTNQKKTDYNLADGLGSGKLLPVDPSKIIKYKNNTNQNVFNQWCLKTNLTETVGGNFKYTFDTIAGGNKLNGLSTNIESTKIKQTQIGDFFFRFLQPINNGWYINNEKIVTKDISSAKKYPSSQSVIPCDFYQNN